MTFHERRRRVEWAIVRAVVTDAIAARLTVSVFDGEETVLRGSTVLAEIRDALFSTDQDTLRFHDRFRRKVGFVQLVYGNSGWDVIHDHSDNERIRAIVARAERIADRMADTFDQWRATR